jgi:hypothetical protein
MINIAGVGMEKKIKKLKKIKRVEFEFRNDCLVLTVICLRCEKSLKTFASEPNLLRFLLSIPHSIGDKNREMV